MGKGHVPDVFKRRLLEAAKCITGQKVESQPYLAKGRAKMQPPCWAALYLAKKWGCRLTGSLCCT